MGCESIRKIEDGKFKGIENIGKVVESANKGFQIAQQIQQGSNLKEKMNAIDIAKQVIGGVKDVAQQCKELQDLQKQIGQPGQQTIQVGKGLLDNSQSITKNLQLLNQNAQDNGENNGTVKFKQNSKLSNQYPSIFPHQKNQSYDKLKFQPIQSNQRTNINQKINKEQFRLSKQKNQAKLYENNLMQKNQNKNLTQQVNIQSNHDSDNQEGVNSVPKINTTKHGQSNVLDMSKMRLTVQQQN